MLKAIARRLVQAMALGCLGAACAADIHVDFEKGSDKAGGSKESPLRSFQAAIKKAAPGDCIIILPASKPINASLIARDKKGIEGKPIVVDGMFNTFVGCKRVDAKDWSETSPGLFVSKRKSPGEAMLLRYFMRFDGVMQRMDRHTKWGKPKFKAVEELQPCEWTIVNGSDFYFKLPQGKGLDEVLVEEPNLISGVQVEGACEFLTFKNMIMKSFWNDGFNIHGQSRNIVFENVAAIENADDGVSAHEDCQIFVKNMLSLKNSTGLCHIDRAECHHENMYIAGCDSRDIFVIMNPTFLKNIVVEGSALGKIEIGNPKSSIENCIFSNLRPGIALAVKPEVAVSDSVYCNYSVDAKAFPSAFKSADPASVKNEIERRRDALFAIFGGRLDEWKPVAKQP